MHFEPGPRNGARQMIRAACHCGAVRFEAIVDTSAGSRCNCSCCNKVGQLSALIKPAGFELLGGEEALSFYEWGGKSVRRFFCKHCGSTASRAAISPRSAARSSA